jgi:hypothetical protein
MPCTSSPRHRPDLCRDCPRFADLSADLAVIERAQELSIILRIVEIDFHMSSSLTPY